MTDWKLPRLAAARTGGRSGRTPRPPRTVRRDLARSLDLLRPPELAGDGEGPSERFLEDVARRQDLRTSDDLTTRLGATWWYHTIDLPGGVTTPGFFDHRPLVADYGLPESLAGQRVLDVATFDGFWAFELEKRGGDVVALDIGNTLDIDLPAAAHERAVREDLGIETGAGFSIAAEALGSSVERRVSSVYDLDPTGWGQFDFVHVGDLLLHLERPWEALRRVRKVCSGTLHISDAFDPTLGQQSVKYLGGWNDVEWWIPSLDCLSQWIIDAGFASVELLRTYRLDGARGRTGFWRAILRARV